VYRAGYDADLATHLAYYGEILLAAISWAKAIGDRYCLRLSSFDCHFELGASREIPIDEAAALILRGLMKLNRKSSAKAPGTT
jgi:hypothetical protein